MSSASEITVVLAGSKILANRLLLRHPRRKCAVLHARDAAEVESRPQKRRTDLVACERQTGDARLRNLLIASRAVT